MAEKSSEEYPCINTDNTSETATSSNNTADKNSEDISGTICTISTSPDKLMPEMFYSFDDPPSELNALPLSMKNLVGKFFDEINDAKYKIRNNDNVNENVNVNENDQNNLVDINIDGNNEPNADGNDEPNADGDNHHGMLVTYKSNLTVENTENHSSLLYCRRYFPEIFFSLYNTTQPLPLSLSLTPPLNLDVHFVKQGQEYIDFMSVFTEHDFCKPFLEKIFSYLSYKDIASMTTVSKTWCKAVSKSANAQKELEKVFIHAILYFCHKNANVSDEYKQLYDKILIHFKNQIQFKKNDF